MKIKDLYISICIAACVLLTATACQQEHDALSPEGTASLTLYFNSPSLSLTRNANEETIQLYYEAVDGKITPCAAPVSMPLTTRAVPDGNTADGGGMSDLAVFLVDKATNNIVAREKLTGLAAGGVGTTEKTLYFLNLEPGDYTVYAYANTEGNDWFSIPADAETSFANYKDALLKPVTTGAPTVSGTMPLTGKLDITVGGGENSGVVSMLRPVGKLSVVVHNEKTGTEAFSVKTPSMGAIFPKTGYVFKHDDILQDNVINPYHALPEDTEEHTVIPGSYHLVYEKYLYETQLNDESIDITMTYEGANYTLHEDYSKELNAISNGENIFVRMKIDSVYMFLRLDQIDGNYQLGLVPETELDDKCVWSLSSNGKQQRGFYNEKYKVYLNTETTTPSFSTNGETLKYGFNNNQVIIGEGNKQLTYNSATGAFVFSNIGTLFDFFKYSENNNSGGTIMEPVEIEKIIENESTPIPLTSIYRNQHIQLNIRFR